MENNFFFFSVSYTAVILINVRKRNLKGTYLIKCERFFGKKKQMMLKTREKIQGIQDEKKTGLILEEKK